MDNRKYLSTTAWMLLICGLLLHLTGTTVFAEDGSADWRPAYDFIMRWINFGILVYLLVRYGRQPFKAFLQGQKEEVAGRIEEVETRKKQMENTIADTRRKIEESTARFEKVKARIIEEGQRLKQQIIDDARQQGQKLIELEQKKADSYFLRAKQAFLAEMVDAAAKYALNRLPGELDDEDHSKMLNLYLSDLNRIVGNSGPAPVN